MFKKAKYGVVNADDPNAGYFVEKYADSDIYTYGIEEGRFRAVEVELDAARVKYACHDMNGEWGDLSDRNTDSREV